MLETQSIYGNDYFGFIYIWLDRKKKRYYIGSHMGSIDDGYICSSNWMRNTYKRRPQDFRRKILYLHKSADRSSLLQEENRWLQMIKPEELKTKYYNRTRFAFGKEIEEIRANAKKSWTPERKEAWAKKMQEWRDRDPTYKERIGCKGHSEETKAKMKESRNKREPASNETRAKMSKSAKARDQGSKNVELHKQKKIGMHGKKHSEETKRKMSKNSRWKKVIL